MPCAKPGSPALGPGIRYAVLSSDESTVLEPVAGSTRKMVGDSAVPLGMLSIRTLPMASRYILLFVISTPELPSGSLRVISSIWRTDRGTPAAGGTRSAGLDRTALSVCCAKHIAKAKGKDSQ